MSRSVLEFSGFDDRDNHDRDNLRFHRGMIVNKICLLFRQIYFNYLILNIK